MVRSIRVRLLLWYAVVLAGVVGGFAGILYYEVRAARLAEVDAQLDAAAASLESALRGFPRFELSGEPPPFPPPKKFGPPPKKKGPPNWPPDRPDFGPELGPEGGPKPKSREELLARLDLPGPPGDRPAGIYYVVWRADGAVLKAVGTTQAEAPAAMPGQPTRIDHGTNRELVIPGPGATTVLVGRSADVVNRDLRSFAWQLVGTGAAVLTVGLAGGWLISRRIFRPLATIASTASRISADNLSARIDTKRVDVELAELACVLNATFSRLEAAFERQARFTADASHELRTPLAVIRSQAELTLSRPRTPDEYQEALHTCLKAAGRMTDLVEGLLTLARADAGRDSIPRTRVELDRVAADAVDLCRPLAERKNIRLLTDIEPVAVRGDAAALARVVGNLVANAIQYNRPGGEVQVVVRPEGGDAQLTVRDTGEGIPEDHHDQLFDRFYRVDRARSRETGGSGLGLAIARTIVEAHRGTIGFKSKVGNGSTFWVRLPIAGQNIEATQVERSKEDRGPRDRD
jgi:two-component system, OmpR family, sensor kinase